MSMSNDLLNEPSVLAVLENILANYDCELVQVDEGLVEAHPQNPPYDEVEYVEPFVDDLKKALTDAGFKALPGQRVPRNFRNGDVLADIDNVMFEDEPIVISFYHAG